jgi:hypothetical protein
MSQGVGNDAPYWAKCGAHPVVCAHKEQMESWKLDIDRGFRALVETNQVLGDAILSNDLGTGVDAYHEWMIEWMPKMLGAHAVGEGAKAMDEFMEWVAKWDPLAPINKAIDAAVMAFMRDEFPREFQLFDMMKNPASYLEQQLGRESAQRVIADLHMGAAPDSLLDWRAFEPLYNSVIVAKLSLLDGDGLNELAKAAGITTPLFPPGGSTDVMLGFMRMMDGNDQWVPGSEFGLPYVAYSSSSKPAAGRLAIPSDRIGRIGRMDRAPSGFPLFADSLAQQKIFGVIFKGCGPGPGPLAADVSVAVITISPRTDGGRALAASADEVEHMRDVVDVIEKRFGGRSALAPPLVIARGAKSWAAQNSARELQELREALAKLQSETSRLRAAPALLGTTGRAGAAAQKLDAPTRELSSRLDRFAAVPDGVAAAAALKAFGDQLTVVARSAAIR